MYNSDFKVSQPVGLPKYNQVFFDPHNKYVEQPPKTMYLGHCVTFNTLMYNLHHFMPSKYIKILFETPLILPR